MNEINQTEWEAPPIPEEIRKTAEPPLMSEAATLGNIFVSPGETFEDLRRKPRFIMALLIIIFLTTTYQLLFIQRMGEDRMHSFMVEQMDKNPMAQSMSPPDKQQAVERGLKTSAVTKYLLPVFLLIFFAVAGLLYWLGGKAMGGAGNYWHGVSAWVYSSFPPTVVAMLANILILFLKSADEIDIATSQRSLINANPGFFLDGKSMPVLTTLLSTLDFFQIWGWILAAIGLQKLMKLPKTSAWTIVLIIALIGLTFRIISAYLTGNPV